MTFLYFLDGKGVKNVLL